MRIDVERRRWTWIMLWFCLGMPNAVRAADEPALPLKEWLERSLLSDGQTMEDVCQLTARATAAWTAPTDRAAWEKTAASLRQQMLDQVVFRGVPPEWRTAKPRVEWFETIETGAGYRVRKLRYEALPGLWVPALLYEPEKLTARAAVGLAVNGHDALGKAAKYKQLRCINMAKRGMLVLNVEWLGMGQLRGPDYVHGKMNQLELSGVAGLAPFYLVMERGLDVLLAHPNADASRVAVSGLSGGGWQTIFISSLDPRVTLSNPVAGYSSFVTRARHHSDLGDSEQTPTDMGMIADYTHLTALRAPRPTLLTYNVKDDCCFASAHALPPLIEAAQPVFRLFDASDRLHQHVNHEPGTHNFEQDNREAYYRMLSTYFSPPGEKWPEKEIPSESELKTAEELQVPLPPDNATFHSLALDAARRVPALKDLPTDRASAEKWRREQIAALRDVVRITELPVTVQRLFEASANDTQVIGWRLRLGQTWTLPVLEITPAKPRGTALVVAEEGRRSCAASVQQLLAEKQRVVLVDPFYWGECTIKQRGYLFALLTATVGQRPLGVQASQLVSVARWLKAEREANEVKLVAQGPRASLAALVAAACEETSVREVELRGSYGSLREALEQNLTYEQAPEVFCLGLLPVTDVRELVATIAPRPVRFVEPTARVQRELAALPAWYKTWGQTFDPRASAAPR